jgi:TonB family protein
MIPLSASVASGGLEALLQRIVKRAKEMTAANGAVIALGDISGMECRASVGIAPDVGSRLGPGIGLSGYCLSTGKLVNCVDVKSDMRADARAVRQLDLGSVVIVPVYALGKLAGLLEVLSQETLAFDEHHLVYLKHCAGLLSAALEEQRRGEALTVAQPLPTPFAEPEAAASAGVAGSEDSAQTQPLVSETGTAADALAVESAASASSPELASTAETSAALAVDARREGNSLSPAGQTPPPGESIRDVSAADLSSAVQGSYRTASGGSCATEPEFLLSTYPELPGERRQFRRSIMAGIAVAAVVFALGAVWWSVHSPVSQSTTPTAAQAAGVPKAAANPSLAITRMADAGSEVQAGSFTANENTGTLATSDRDAATMWQPNPRSEIAVVVNPLAVAVGSGHPKGAEGASHLRPGKLLHTVEPKYPPAALAGGVSGSVVLAVLVTRDGAVESLKVVRGPEVLAREAVEAVRHWRYQPYRLDGKPVDVQTTLTLKFTLQP